MKADKLEQKVYQVKKDLLDLTVLLDPQEHLDLKAHQVSKDLTDQKDNMYVFIIIILVNFN